MPIGQWFRRHGAVCMIAVIASATSTACTASDEPSSPVTHRAKHVVAFIGDSYTDPPFGGPAYWQTTAFRMCWQAEPFGVSGSGYTIAGTDGRGPYVTRIEEVVAVKPDIVIVQGSFNDREPDIVQLAAAIMFRSLHERLPAARVFAMGPVTPSLPGAGPQVTRISDAVKSAADANFSVFVDARHFLDDPRMYSPDQIHPTAEGHQIIGAALAGALPAELSSCE
jgi:acyl-CoA thioesterase-1